MKETAVIVLCAIGVAFSLSGVVGILRMPDVYSRIQCSSKTITMGALPVLIAVTVGEGPISQYGSRALIVAVLLLVLNPAASHALARAAYKTGIPMKNAVRDEPRERRARGGDAAGDSAGGSTGDSAGDSAGDGKAGS